ncbi:uncharacterized protein PV07_05958 [Cladophialophora immunda]|uniref:Glycosyl hydrolase family 13 catalytic domain-containing protein n=1 Tax=Cladophialophora immunda TaxID=569365 RepID=A0A0D2CGE4_9EURO|nr:uncharacterized protein PV07_05958 [Cladophialophora immunda]KIW30198.1 hypothetical protein PV07_05958 [Cladophialophora immunda]OQU95852.1 Alpha amylase, catalytic domain-containing protein [Cladophialophora immunda]
MAAEINLQEVGAHPSFERPNRFSVQIGLYLPGIRHADGFQVVVRIIHRDDRFNQTVSPQDFDLDWVDGSALDHWTKSIPITPVSGTHYGTEGVYLYRFQLWFTPGGGSRQLVTRWFTDPFARATDVGSLAAFTLSRSPTTFAWNDGSYKTPQLDDLVVYELQVEEFNDTFDGVAERLDYFRSLGVNCLELMPVTSTKLDFDWGYGPLHYFAPNARFGGPDGLKRLVDACHKADIAVILDVVYQHVDPSFPYKLVYQDVKDFPGTPQIDSPMIGGDGPFGPQIAFSKTFAQDYFACANRRWLEEYHVDGFRYDEVTDLFVSPTDSGYAKLCYDTYQCSTRIDRFRREAGSYSRIIQCAEALSKAREVLRGTYTSCAWQDDLLNKSESMIRNNVADADFAHFLDPNFCQYPSTKTVEDANGKSAEMPVAPFQYLETHDHSQLIVFAGTTGGGSYPSGDRSKFYKLQPFAVALYTLQGVPMLWQGQEFADNYQLPKSGDERVGLRRDTHWEFFYDEVGSTLVRLYRRLGMLRRTYPALRSRDSFFYFRQSLQGTQIVAYHRHAGPTSTAPEQFVMVLLNFADAAGSITLPFPKAGTWTEMIDADTRTLTVQVPVDGAEVSTDVPSHYGHVFVWAG